MSEVLRNFPNHKLMVIGFILILSACSNDINRSLTTQEQTFIKASSVEYVPYDDKLLAVSKLLVGFANLHYNAQGGLEVGLLEGSPVYQSRDEAAVRAAIMTVFGPNALPGGENAQGAADIVLQSGKYPFSDLYKWRMKARQFFAEDGIQTLDIDDETNRIYIEVKTKAAEDKVASQLRAIGVPDGAITFGYIGESIPLANLDSRVRPLIGGLNVYCTLGYPAVRQGVPGFITNSHCMDVMGGSTGTKHYQPGYPVKNQADFVGTETVDPAYQSGGTGSCPSGAKCRYADSAFVAVASGISIKRGQIAKLSNGVITSTNYEVAFVETLQDSSDPDRTIYVVGSIHKVGHTTGHTRVPTSDSGAAQLNPCRDHSYTKDGQKYVFFCQSYVPGLRADRGDSGSPVFTMTRDGIRVTAIGLLYAISTDAAGNPTGGYFSPINAVLSGLGMTESSIIAP